MKTLKEMNMGELRSLYIEWRELYIQTGCEDFRNNAIAVHNEYLSRVAPTQQTTIEVTFELGYKWSVSVQGEDESRVTDVNKATAMQIARQINKAEFNNKCIIAAQKLSKEERTENMQWLHENTYTFNTNKVI